MRMSDPNSSEQSTARPLSSTVLMSGQPISTEDFCEILWPRLLTVTLFNLIFSILTLSCFHRILRSYSSLNKSEKSRAQRFVVLVALSGCLMPMVHLTIPWSWVIQNRRLHAVSLLCTGLLAFIAITGLFMFELWKLHEVFKNSTYKLEQRTYRMYSAAWIIGSLCFAAWMLLNEELHGRQSMWHVILLFGLALTGGLIFIGSFVSLSCQLGRRLIDLVVSTQTQVEIQRRRTASMISLTASRSTSSMISSVSVTNTSEDSTIPDSTLIMAMPSLDNRSSMKRTTSSQTLHTQGPLPTIYDDTEADDMKMEQPTIPECRSFGERAATMMRDFRQASLDDFGSNQRPFLESTGRQFVFSFMTSMAVLMVIIATICWSFSSCFQFPSIIAFVLETLGFGIGVLRLYLSDPNRVAEYEWLCGPLNHFAVKAVTLATNVQLRGQLDHVGHEEVENAHSNCIADSNIDGINDTSLESESVHFEGSSLPRC